MESDEKQVLYIVAIVALVAIVAIILMSVRTKQGAATQEDAAGNARAMFNSYGECMNYCTNTGTGGYDAYMWCRSDCLQNSRGTAYTS